MNAPLLGVDLGGTKIEIAALSRDDGRFLLRERVATPRGCYTAVLEAVATLVKNAESQLGVVGLPLGIGMPGCISPATGLVKGANSTGLNGRAFDKDLEQALQRPVRAENDANCLAVSEAVDGAAAGERVVFAVILGTGVGKPIEREADGFHARVVQHECDHLIGRLYPTRMTDLTKLGFTSVLFPELDAAADD